MGYSEDRELDKDSLIAETFRTAMKELQSKVNHGKDVPMSEFAKILIWAKENRQKIFHEEIERDKLQGWKIESHTWCGVPVKDFAIPSLGIYAN